VLGPQSDPDLTQPAPDLVCNSITKLIDLLLTCHLPKPRHLGVPQCHQKTFLVLLVTPESKPPQLWSPTPGMNPVRQEAT